MEKPHGTGWNWKAEAEARRKRDAERFAAIDKDTCMLCGAQGPDKRSLFLRCFYAVDEVVPEMIDLSDVEGKFNGQGWYARICKGCRGRFLDHLAVWRNECVALREVDKDSDGNPTSTEPERNICVRQNGRIVYLTREEYAELYPGREPFVLNRQQQQEE